MKKLKLVLAICVVAAMIASCKKDDDTSPTQCTTECQNGGIVNTNCGCDCPTGYTGANCETTVYTAINVPIDNTVIHQLPPIKYQGDNEFGGHSSMSWNAQLTISTDKKKVYAVINASFIELGGDTKAKVDGNLSANRITLYTAPTGKKVNSINSGTYYASSFTPNTNQFIIHTEYVNGFGFVHKVEVLGDTSGSDLPSDGTTNNSRFRIWFDDINITLTNQ